MRRLRKLITSFRCNNAGTGALELGLSLPILMVLLLGMIDVSRLIATRIDVEQVAQRATDYALAHRPSDSSIKTDVKAIKSEASKDPDVDAADVVVDIFLECDGVRESSYKTTCADGADTARFVSVEVDRYVDFLFNWGGLSSVLGLNDLGQGATVRGDSIVRFQ